MENLNIIEHQWWSTPVWEVETDYDEHFNQSLLKDIQNEKYYKHPNLMKDVYNCESEIVGEIKNRALDIVKENTLSYAKDYSKLFHDRAWLNFVDPGSNLPLHVHGGTPIAITYYVSVENGCGDLIICDPRGGVNWDIGSEIWEGNEITGIKHKRIKPKQSGFVFFPGFLFHMVDTNKSNKQRISLTSNINAMRINNEK